MVAGKETEQVKVWGSASVKMPVPGMDYTMVEISFGHERLSEDGSEKSIKKAANKLHKFNEEQLNAKLKEFISQIEDALQ